jgi:ribosomal protein S18 acetylase RimI-like enzyme
MIRKAALSDLESILSIEQQFGAEAFSKRSLRHLVLNGSTLVVDEGDIRGYASVLLRSNSSIARLYSLAVSEQYQRIGYGKALLESALDRAREAERGALALEVSATNLSARALYDRSGFLPIAELPDYYADGSSAIRMKKVIV